MALLTVGGCACSETDLMVYLDTPTDIRLEQLQQHEAVRFGKRIRTGGDMAQQYLDFLGYAVKCDTDGPHRNRYRHQAWLASCNRPVLRPDGNRTIADQVTLVLDTLAARG